MTTPPTVFNANGTFAVEGCASIADAAGNLLFYTDGTNIQNKLFTLMANGNGILGASLSQNILIAKQPGTNPLYYLFISDGSAFRYSIIDMSLAAGMGSVTVKNTTLTAIPQSYKVAGTRHCNGSDLWIVSQDHGTTTMRAYLLTAAGLSVTPVLSTSTFVHDTYAELKFSSDGNKLASTEYGSNIQLFDFNIATGAASTGTTIGNVPGPLYGVEFSPDGTKLYGNRFGQEVFQWNLCAGSISAINASQFTVNPTSGVIKRAMQLGPDGKIYITRNATQELAVINNPNSAGAACNYVETGQSIAPKSSTYGLPNFIKPRFVQASVAHTMASGGCQTASFTTSMFPGGLITCMSTTGTPVWNFGDPSSGSSNTSTGFNPTHTYPGPGSYTAVLVLSYNCGADTIRYPITIAGNASTLHISGNLNVCEGQTTTLTASGASNYTWTGNGASQTGSVITVNQITSGTTVYTVTGSGGTGCPAVTTVTLHLLTPSILTVSGTTLICAGR